MNMSRVKMFEDFSIPSVMLLFLSSKKGENKSLTCHQDARWGGVRGGGGHKLLHNFLRTLDLSFPSTNSPWKFETVERTQRTLLLGSATAFALEWLSLLGPGRYPFVFRSQTKVGLQGDLASFYFIPTYNKIKEQIVGYSCPFSNIVV